LRARARNGEGAARSRSLLSRRFGAGFARRRPVSAAARGARAGRVGPALGGGRTKGDRGYRRKRRRERPVRGGAFHLYLARSSIRNGSTPSREARSALA